MASSRDTRAGGAFVEVYTVDSKFRQGLLNAQNHLKKFAMGAQQMGQTLAVAGGLVLAAFLPAIQTMADFNDRMSAVGAFAGSTASELEKLTDKARDLGATTSFTASQVADGMTDLAKAGFSATQILEGIPEILLLSRAGAIEMGAAAEIAANAMTSMGLATKDLGMIVDLMAQTANASTTDIADIGETLKYAAPAARLAGQDFEELSAAIAVLASNGLRGSNAGTGLAGVLKVLAKESEILGVKIVDANDQIRPMLDIMRELGEATKDFTEAERLTFFYSKFGALHGKTAAGLALSTQKIDEMRQAMDKAAGSAETAATKLDDNFGGKLRKLRSSIESMFISIGNAVEPSLTKWSIWLTGVINGIDKWTKANPGLTTTIMTLGGVVAGLGVTLTSLGYTLLGINTAVTGLTAVYATLGSVIATKAIPEIKLFIWYTQVMAGAGSKWAMSLTALGWTISGLAVAVAGFKLGQFLNQFIYGRDTIYGFNEQLERSRQLTEAMGDLTSNRERKIRWNATKITDPQQRQEYYQQQISEVDKDIKGKEAALARAREQVERAYLDGSGLNVDRAAKGLEPLDKAPDATKYLMDNVIGNDLVKLAKEEVAEAEESLKRSRDFRQTLKDEAEMDASVAAPAMPAVPNITPEEAAAAQAPFLEVPEASIDVGREAVAQSVQKMPLMLPSIDDQDALVEAMTSAMESVFSKLFEKAHAANELSQKLLTEVIGIHAIAKNFPELRGAAPL